MAAGLMQNLQRAAEDLSKQVATGAPPSRAKIEGMRQILEDLYLLAGRTPPDEDERGSWDRVSKTSSSPLDSSKDLSGGLDTDLLDPSSSHSESSSPSPLVSDPCPTPDRCLIVTILVLPTSSPSASDASKHSTASPSTGTPTGGVPKGPSSPVGLGNLKQFESPPAPATPSDPSAGTKAETPASPPTAGPRFRGGYECNCLGCRIMKEARAPR